MEEYVFPNKWYIEITDENKEILNAWKINQIDYNSPIDVYYPPIKYINCYGAGIPQTYWPSWGDAPSYIKITFDQFKKYVLGYEIIKEPANQDYTYLIDMLNKKNNEWISFNNNTKRI
jgi:hypothetical protein